MSQGASIHSKTVIKETCYKIKRYNGHLYLGYWEGNKLLFWDTFFTIHGYESRLENGSFVRFSGDGKHMLIRCMDGSILPIEYTKRNFAKYVL